MIEITVQNVKDNDKYLDTIIESGKPSLEGCDIERLFTMLGIFNDTTFRNDIDKAYEQDALNYYKAYTENITQTEKAYMNSLTLEEHDGVKKLMGMYIRCKELDDFTPFIPILRRRFKKLYNYISTNPSKYVVASSILPLHTFKFSRGEIVDTITLVAITELITYINNQILLSDRARASSIKFVANQYLVSRLYIESMTESEFLSITKDIEIEASIGSNDSGTQERMARIKAILNPKNKKLKIWNELLFECYPTDDAKVKLSKEFAKWQVYGINFGVSVLDIFNRRYDEALYTNIVSKIASSFTKTDIVEETVKIFFFMSLIIMDLRKNLHLTSVKCYEDSDKQVELKCYELEQRLNSEIDKVKLEQLQLNNAKSALEHKVAGLEKDISQKETEISNLKQQLETYSVEKYELEMYRRHNYIVTLQESEETLENKIEVCNNKYVIIGGNPDWQRKLSALLPNVDFYDIKDFSRYRNSLKKYDNIFINVTFTGHSSYWKLMDYLSYSKLKADYLSGYPNTTRCINEMYQILKDN